MKVTRAQGTATKFSIPGLKSQATIRIDSFGVPHINAEHTTDLYLAQGFNAARDRLWQLDLWRKRGLGLLSASFGPGYLLQDRAARLFLYRGDMEREWASYGNRNTQEIVSSFVAGINAFIEFAMTDPGLLPPEFSATGSKPDFWLPQDVVRIRSHALGRNVPSEVARARMYAAGGSATTDLARRAVEPARNPVIPDGLNVHDVPADVLDDFLLGTAGVSFSEERLNATMSDAQRWRSVSAAGEVARIAEAEGSNNWAVSPSRTETGRPIVASDPHRSYGAPSLRYVVHLKAPGIDAIGAGEPMLPGVALGHNENVAFSLTSFFMDQEDLYIYELHPTDDGQYRYGDGWLNFEQVHEEFVVAGERRQTLPLLFSRHGPVIKIDSVARRAYAVRTVWTEAGTSAYLGSLAYQSCKTIEEFERSLDHWLVPSNNHVVADTGGRIAWFAAGMSPVREGWDGLLPVPGDGRYEWAGFHHRDKFPSQMEPQIGFVYSANEMNLPPGPAQEMGFGYEWAESFRGQRIAEVLRAPAPHSLEDSKRLQQDTLSIPARRLCAMVLDLSVQPIEVRLVLALLRDWDFHLSSGSATALFFETWWMHHLRPLLLDAAAPNLTARALMGLGDLETLVNWLEKPERFLVGEAYAVRDALLVRSIGAAAADCCRRFGNDPATWRWGAYHHGYFPHVLSTLKGAGFGDVGPLEIGGSSATVLNTTYRLNDARTMIGPSFRMVLDVGEWDNSVFVNAPGQSGNPNFASYRNHSLAWARGEYFPLLFSDDAVERSTVAVIELLPVAPDTFNQL